MYGIRYDNVSTYNRTKLTDYYVEISLHDSQSHLMPQSPYFFIFLTMVGWLMPKCLAISLVDLN